MTGYLLFLACLEDRFEVRIFIVGACRNLSVMLFTFEAKSFQIIGI
jgi:hypothetical protein